MTALNLTALPLGKPILVGALCVHLAACGVSTGQTPVINKSPYRVIPAETVALSDDSVYSIAWRFGLDYQKIAKWNGLAKPYKIRTGQRLRLSASGASQSASPPATTVTAVTATATTSQAKPAASPSTLPATPTPSAKSTPRQVATPKAATPTQPVATATAPSKWNWPAEGKLIGKFSRSGGQNGIKIAGASGSAIRSTAAGEVVYTGEGLRGYGKLIIVKHSPSYLSAYAHNRDILVAEGDRIQSGQQIAQMGNSGAERTMLHFEIRKNGKPVDPLPFLP